MRANSDRLTPVDHSAAINALSRSLRQRARASLMSSGVAVGWGLGFCGRCGTRTHDPLLVREVL